MRLALMSACRGSATDHFIYSHARVLSYRCELTCYLSAESTLLDRYKDLPCRVRAFDWKRGYKRFVAAVLSRRDTSGMSEAILEDKPDIVLNTHLCCWSGLIHRKLRGKVPIAAVLHDAVPHPGMMGKLSLALDVVYPPVADVIVGISDYTYDGAKRRYPGRTHIRSKHGVFHVNPDVDSDAVASRRNLLLYLGRIEPYKGIDVLVEAFAEAKSSNADLKLDIVGRGAIKPKVLARISELGIGLNNKYVSDEELKQVVASHGVMVMPYTSATQSGVAAVALGNGLPAIATRVGALPEQAIDGRNGIIVPPQDSHALAKAMLEVAGDSEKAKRMSQEAVRVGKEEYSWETISTKLLEDLEQYLCERRGAITRQASNT